MLHLLPLFYPIFTCGDPDPQSSWIRIQIHNTVILLCSRLKCKNWTVCTILISCPVATFHAHKLKWGTPSPPPNKQKVGKFCVKKGKINSYSYSGESGQVLYALLENLSSSKWDKSCNSLPDSSERNHLKSGLRIETCLKEKIKKVTYRSRLWDEKNA